jgi:hypothetical protein
MRGGGWGSLGPDFQAANRQGLPPTYRIFILGFRLARVPVPSANSSSPTAKKQKLDKKRSGKTGVAAV